MARDPHLVLGLAPGASAAEVKRAYRRLAKEHHPDSAGETALPRFLEIQRAYEQLTSTAWRPGQRRPAAAEPWRADPTRARSTPGAAGTPGAAHRPSSGRAEPRPGPAAGTRPKSSTGTRTEGASGRRRPARKATFGSTTYDEAHDPADPTWTGAAWYGPTSGEYWQVNPREYADPRKHGPEYLARAAARTAAAAERRARQQSGPGQEGAPGPATPGPETAPGPKAAPEPNAAPEPAASAEPQEQGPAPRARPHRSPAGPRPRPIATRERSAASARNEGSASGRTTGITLSPGVRRLIRAVIAWPPLGIAAAALIGEATGCAAFEATCTPPADLYPWFAQGAIVLALLAVPSIARVLAGGTAAVALLAFPVAAALSAGGANYDRARGPAALIAVLAMVWALGVGAMVLRRAVTRAIP